MLIPANALLRMNALLSVADFAQAADLQDNFFEHYVRSFTGTPVFIGVALKKPKHLGSFNWNKQTRASDGTMRASNDSWLFGNSTGTIRHCFRQPSQRSQANTTSRVSLCCSKSRTLKCIVHHGLVCEPTRARQQMRAFDDRRSRVQDILQLAHKFPLFLGISFFE